MPATVDIHNRNRFVRYAIFSDIHGNLEALDAVLQASAKDPPDVYLCLGDLVGYGADPNECVERVWSLTDRVIAGNHDHAAVGKLDLVYFNHNAAEAALWTMQRLTRSVSQYLGDLPLSLPYETFLAVHATPAHPERWGYVLSVAHAAEAFQAMSAGTGLCFIGHTHEPVIFKESDGQCRRSAELICELQPGARYLVNVGSVGQPRDGDPRATWCVYDTDTNRIEIRRTGYDVPTAQKKIRKAGLPDFLAERLAHGR